VADDGSVGALVWNVAGRSALELFDPASGRRTPVANVPTELVGGVTFSRDGRRLAWSGTGAAATPDVYVLDRASGAITRVTYSPTPGVDLGAAVRPELVRFRAHDGVALTGWLYRPRGAGGAPAAYVVDFHGGPEGQARPALNATYQALLARGIGVFAPNVRGSSGFGKRFVNLDNGAMRENAVRDIRACAEYLTANRIADPRRVGIMGGSYGGYMVMAGLADYPDRFAAGVNLFGVVNFATFFKNTEPWMAAISTVEYGNPATEARCSGASPRSTASTGSPRRRSCCTARTTRTCRWSRPSRWSRRSSGATCPWSTCSSRRGARLAEDRQPRALDGRDRALVRAAPRAGAGRRGGAGALSARRRRDRYRSSANPGSTGGRWLAFATIHPVAYIHRVTRVSLA
jgi:hypothetical protein